MMDGSTTWLDDGADAQREIDLDRWRSTFDLMREHVEADPTYVAAWQQLDALAHVRDTEAREIVERMVRRPDVDLFARDLEQWSRKPGPYANAASLAKHWLPRVMAHCEGRVGELEDALSKALVLPTTYDDAAAAIRGVEEVIGAGGPDLSRVPTLLSALWATAGEGDWPILWTGGSDTYQTLGWMGRHLTHAERYIDFVALCRAFSPGDAYRAQRIVTALGEKPAFVGFGSALPQLADEAAALHETFEPGVGYADGEDEARRLVVRGFFADIINKIGVAEVVEPLMEAIDAELAATATIAGEQA